MQHPSSHKIQGILLLLGYILLNINIFVYPKIFGSRQEHFNFYTEIFPPSNDASSYLLPARQGTVAVIMLKLVADVLLL